MKLFLFITSFCSTLITDTAFVYDLMCMYSFEEQGQLRYIWNVVPSALNQSPTYTYCFSTIKFTFWGCYNFLISLSFIFLCPSAFACPGSCGILFNIYPGFYFNDEEMKWNACVMCLSFCVVFSFSRGFLCVIWQVYGAFLSSLGYVIVLCRQHVRKLTSLQQSVPAKVFNNRNI
jgi:hypothetical protein